MAEVPLWLVLDGAILVISAKDGAGPDPYSVPCPAENEHSTVIFINKIDQAGVDLQSVVQSVRDKLSADIIITDGVAVPGNSPEENTDIEAWTRSSKITINYWKSISQNQSAGKNAVEEQRRVQDASCSRSIMAAPKGPWHSTVDGW